MAPDIDTDMPAVAAATLRSEMGASPDASLNETINLFDVDLPAAKSTITHLSDATLEDLQATVEHEIATRSPAGRGAASFRRSFRRKLRDQQARIGIVNDMLEQMDGAIIEFFDQHEVDTDASYTPVVTDGAFLRGQLNMRAGHLRIVVVVRYSDDLTVKAATVRGRISSRWGRTLSTFDGDDPEPEKALESAIAAFARWAARHTTEA